MTLRTRGILLSLLPLLITLLLLIPEVIVQVNSSQAVYRGTASDFLSQIAHDVEENALNVGASAWDGARRQPGAELEFGRAVSKANSSVRLLQSLSAGSNSTREAADEVGAAVSAYTQLGEAVMRDARQGGIVRALASSTARNFAVAGTQVRETVETFDEKEHSDELTALSALQQLWKSSLFLLAIVVAGLALASGLQTFHSGRLIDSIVKLGRDAESYRRGEPLGIASPRRDEIGALDAAIHEFVAAKRQRDNELKRYRLLADITHDIILFVDRTTLTVVDANVAALKAYGYDDLIGKPMAVLHAPADPLKVNSDMIALSDRPEGLSYEGLHQRSDGTIFPVEVHARTAEVEGKLTIVKTIRDISERRRADEQISLALDKAVEASRLKSEFVATMSHEIRTPMHGVIGMSELLLGTQLMPLQREYAATVKESAQGLLTIIDDILDFSKLEANKIELEIVPFEPAQVVTGAMNLARGTALEKGVRLRSVLSPHVPVVVRGDPTRLRQVLINLIGNAVKFTAAGEIAVSVSVERDDGHGLLLMFAVSDTGIGVTPKAREQLFQAFVQGDGSTTRRFGGTGLGLSISRRLVALMGGRIWLDEHEGPGSTFCFTARVERTSEIVAPVILDPGALRVFVLDDDKATRRTFQATLTAWGMHNASSADIASTRLRLREATKNGVPFDVVLIDYVLPQNDGLEFAAELAERPEYGSPASVLVTAFDAVGRKDAALAAGCADYLPKPVDPSVLYEALGKIESRRRAHVTPTGSKPRHARILMAEDSSLIRRVARHQLTELEYAVDIVENGEQAVEAASTGDYELVLMDMRMPEMDGLDATRAIRLAEQKTGRHIVVIALTANVLEGDREACTEAGMDDFLAKPLKLDTLRTILQHWLPKAS
jgi:PAS domain S-box-containing protein